jgi:hypothetical protein
LIRNMRRLIKEASKERLVCLGDKGEPREHDRFQVEEACLSKGEVT